MLYMRGVQALRVLVTAALPYSYAPRHFGHLAGVYLPADIFARYMRLRGHDVLFVSGTDENATSIVLEAMRRGMTPRELCDYFYPIQKKVFDRLGISFDIFSRTSNPMHYKVCEEFYRTLWRKGYVYPRRVRQLYCPRDEKILPDRFVKGVCPRCGAPDQYGEACEVCGAFYEAYELIDPRCSLCGSTPQIVESTHFFLRLSLLTEPVKQYVKEKTFWRKATYNKTLSWLEGEGLRDKDITREYDWGPPAPFPGAEGQVLYNWVENLLGYISATRELSLARGEPDLWRRFWQDDATKIYCFLGKDNLFFHTMLFPALLIAHGGYTLPYNVVVSEFVGLMGRKISTSRGWVVWLHDLLGILDPDVIRFYATMISPETRDTDFDWRDLQERVNNVLIATLGNLVHRVLNLIHSKFDGLVPEPGPIDPVGEGLLAMIKSTAGEVARSIESCEFRSGFLKILELAQAGNKYLSERKPWMGGEEAATALYVLSQLVKSLSTLIYPYLPSTSKRIREFLGIEPETRSWDEIEEGLVPGQRIGKPEILYRKIPDEVVEEQINLLLQSQRSQTAS